MYFSICVSSGLFLYKYVKTNQIRTIKVHLLRAFYSQEVNHCSLCPNRDSKAGRGVGKLHSRRQKDFRCALIEDCWHGEVVTKTTRCRGSHVIGQGEFFAFFAWFEVGGNDKNREIIY